MTSIWSKIPALVIELRQHLADRWSAKQTSDALSRTAGQSISRNAVIGKARRDGITFESGMDGKYKRGPYKSRRQVPINIVRQKALSIDLPDEQPKQADFIGLTILEVKANQCKYPHGERVPYSFCGVPVWADSPYCRHHHLICNTGIPQFKKQGERHEFNGIPGGSLQNSARRKTSF